MKWMISLLISMVFLVSCKTSIEAPEQESQENQTDESEENMNETEEENGQEQPDESEEQADESEESQDDIEYLFSNQPETIVYQLDSPWNIVKNGDEFYITERSGSIVHFVGESSERQSLQLEHEVASGQGEEGLLGMVLDSDDQQKAYIYHTYQTEDGLFNRIVAIELSETTWQEAEVLVDKIPAGRIHDGGRLAIGPDGYLYATTGDAGNESLSQDPESLAGKILRLELDGFIPEDQPFENSYVYSYGHRNPQGLDWNQDGELYSSEHGSSAYDEINHIEPGSNYGWPVVRGDESDENMEVPTIHSGEETWAPSGAAFGEDGLFYMTGLAGQSFYRFDLESGEEEILLDNQGRLRDILIEVGEIYVLTNNTDGRGNPEETDDRLLKITQ